AQGRALYTERSPAELYRGPGAASASVTLGLGVPGNLLWRISGVSRRADSERSGPPALSARKLPAQEGPARGVRRSGLHRLLGHELQRHRREFFHRLLFDDP